MSALNAKFDTLREIPELDDVLVGRIREWIASAPESELFRINLVELANRFSIELATLIELFLHMTKKGMTDLSWDIHCPQCNVILDRPNSLAKARRVHHCVYCKKDVASRIDDHFEVTFTVNESLRKVNGRAGYQPSANVEILCRAKIEAGAALTEKFEIPEHVRNLRFVAWPPLNVVVAPVGHGSASPQIAFNSDGTDEFPQEISHETGKIEFINKQNAAKNVMIENHDMAEYAPGEVTPRLRGIDVTSSPVFRDIFASETLSDRESLSIREITIVFTDITGSTALYESLGDISAYNLVRDHFNILFASIRKQNGHIVKTIGDAVMAGFPNPAAAVAALLEVQGALSEFNNREKAPGKISIRAGIHCGTAILVTLNRGLDYFGTTVNEAARIEHACPPDAIALSDEVLNGPGVRRLIEHLPIETIETDLRGLRKKYRIHRVGPE